MNSADSAASDIGFRCAGSPRGDSSGDERSSGGVGTEREMEREREGDRAEGAELCKSALLCSSLIVFNTALRCIALHCHEVGRLSTDRTSSRKVQTITN